MRNLEQAGERNAQPLRPQVARHAHSNQVREFLLTDHGVDLRTSMSAPTAFLSDRLVAAQEMRDRASAAVSRRDVEQKKGELERKHKAFAARIAELEAAYAAEAYDIKEAIVQEEGRLQGMLAGRSALATDRQRATKGGRR